MATFNTRVCVKLEVMPKKAEKRLTTKVKHNKGEISHFEQLKSHWSKKHKALRSQIRKKHRDAFEWMGEKVPGREHVAGAAVGALMLTNTLPAVAATVAPVIDDKRDEQVAKVDKTDLLLTHLAGALPHEVRPLTIAEEALVGEILTDDFGIPSSAEYEGKRLNRSYGYIGAEQHLMRYPGDIMYSHLSASDAQDKYIYSSGMAPGRGAWGYFARSKSDMTNLDIEREKWYLAAPTFLSPGFMQNVKDHYSWFKYRKMLVVNPKTGQAVIAVMGDAGPAAWTGKHLGGSPEVMIALGLEKGPRKGGVLYYFVDDPQDKLPLGPVRAGDYNLQVSKTSNEHDN